MYTAAGMLHVHVDKLVEVLLFSTMKDFTWGDKEPRGWFFVIDTSIIAPAVFETSALSAFGFGD